MRALITVESRYVRSPDGTVWTYDSYAYQFFAHYLTAFDGVRVVARVQDVPNPPAKAHPVGGPGVTVWPLPYYQGPRQYLRRLPAVRRSLAGAVATDDGPAAVILRVPSFIGSLLAGLLDRQGRPYAMEVMADPYDAFAPGSMSHPLQPLVRLRYSARLKQLCRRAIAVSYVTDSYLQRRYPPGRTALSTAYSCVDLSADAYVARPRDIERTSTARTLISVGSLDWITKGVDTTIAALARLNAAGHQLRLVHLGDGRCRPRLAEFAARLGVSDQVTFAGHLPAGEAVRRQLDAADMFVMPSRAEGIPNAMVEAMARGLPAIGSHVGGIPEVLPTRYLVPPDNVPALATAIDRLITDPELMATASAANLGRAADYSAEVLLPRRSAFYQQLRAAVEQTTGIERSQRHHPAAAEAEDRLATTGTRTGVAASGPTEVEPVTRPGSDGS
ncbi:glycosyltransferase family 4 protein [Plantactinospora sp. GCM10030261]|uniref:glycosyltransferase family 4 protein n=1 Tax=Plantactinospora sp. GCM10030261 TaxID=3273420 RepID=UPI003605EF39